MEDHPVLRYPRFVAIVLAPILAFAFTGQLYLQPCFAQTQAVDARGWLHKVRIAAYPVSSAEADHIVKQATADHVYGIEVDNDITGRYESLLHPEQKLDALRKVAQAAHRAHNKVFVYVAGTECISQNTGSVHTLATDHPDWLQRNHAGEPAVFDNSAAFWIRPGEEDAWISPFATSWRSLYMQRIREIASTGVDGIYVDIPYWMTHFKHWEDTWASFDDNTVEAFRQKTGLDARRDVKLGDFSDPHFLRWVDFRIASITDFLAEIRRVAVAANPNISLIPEIYPGIESDAPRVGSDVYQIYPVADAIAHEYEFGGGDDHTAAMRSQYDWMMYQIGMRSFQAFAESKATWMLNYSWDGATAVLPSDAMRTMFASELMAGANLWDASGHVMSGSNDLAIRREVYAWVASYPDIFSQIQTPRGDIGVYFSDTTRNHHADDFIESYRGALLTLLEAHRQFRIITPRTLQTFAGKALVLPNVLDLSKEEVTALKAYVAHGGRIITTGQTSTDIQDSLATARLPADPPRQFLASAQRDFAGADLAIAADFLHALPPTDGTEPVISATKYVAAHTREIHQQTYIFLTNFAGLLPGKQLQPATQNDIRVEVPASFGSTLQFLPFLGSPRTVKGTLVQGRIIFTLPPLERAAVVWFK